MGITAVSTVYIFNLIYINFDHFISILNVKKDQTNKGERVICSYVLMMLCGCGLEMFRLWYLFSAVGECVLWHLDLSGVQWQTQGTGSTHQLRQASHQLFQFHYCI